jgi:hypothetical protein
MGANTSLSLKRLSWKLAILFAITCPKRVSSLTSLDLNHYRILPEGVVFTLTVPTKGTRPFFTRYPTDPVLCPVDCFTHYLTLTREKRVAQQGKPINLFISYIKPPHPVTKATIACWILSLIKEAGIDTEIFKAYSVRGASTTAAANVLVPLQEILNMADWSNASTFCQFYYKPVLERQCFHSLHCFQDVCILLLSYINGVALNSTTCILIYFARSSRNIIAIYFARSSRNIIANYTRADEPVGIIGVI